MSETNPFDPKELAEVARAAKDVLPQTVSQADEALSTIVGWFNNVVLYPVKKANISYKYKLECFEDDFRGKVLTIQEGKLCEPNLLIAGPTLEALKYTYDVQELREMYVNLLSSSMNMDYVAIVHPSFVDIIRQLTPDEAKLLNLLKADGKHAVVDIRQQLPDDGGEVDIIKDFSHISYGVCECPENIGAYLGNLQRLGIITIPDNRHLSEDAHYDLIRNNPLIAPYVSEGKNVFKKKCLIVTSFGENLLKCCIE